MARTRPNFLFLPPDATPEQMQARIDVWSARYPNRPEYPEEEVIEFFSLAATLNLCSHRQLQHHVQRHRVAVPAGVMADMRRLGRHLLQRWREPAVRECLRRAVRWNRKELETLLRQGPLEAYRQLARLYGCVMALYVLRNGGITLPAAELFAALPGPGPELGRLSLEYAGLLLHRYLTEGERQWGQPTRREQQALIRRIRRRELQLQSLRRSLHTLGVQHRALLGRYRRAGRAAGEELERILGRLEAVQAELAGAEAAHHQAMAAAAAARRAELAGLEAQLQTLRREAAAVLAERQAWAGGAALAGAVVAVVGDSGRAQGYRDLVESLGGRAVFVDALEKLNRIPGAVAGADYLILMSGQAKHAAEHRLRKALPPGALLLRCPRGGLAAFARVLHTEVIPRHLSPTRQAAAARQNVPTRQAVAARQAGPAPATSQPGQWSATLFPREGA